MTDPEPKASDTRTHLRELMAALEPKASDTYAHLRELMATQFRGYDEAINLLRFTASSQPAPGVLGERLDAVKEITENRFRELDVRTNALAVSNQKSIDLALQAAKEAAAKSESAFNKQMDSIGERMAQGAASIEGRFNDLKERVTTIEASGAGSKQSVGMIMVFVSMAISGISATFAIIMAILKFGS